ncbi:MAG: hypothetical protein WB987_08270 [Candidatus Acidiferrales bacterium]
MNQTTGGDAGIRGRRTMIERSLSALRILAINFIIFAVLAELFCLVYINVTNWPSSKPSYRLNYNSFWADINPAFGVWHRPNGHYYHKGGCYNVEYTTNSYGARDVERSLHSSKPRTVVLGDSFIEGMGLPAEERLTNILERETGREHLNFGTGGDFGPLQYALLYKTMAAAFDHDLVVVGVLPDNDFHDMDLAYWKAHGIAGRYRPYYADDFSIFYRGHFKPNAGEGFWDRVEAVLRAYLASYHVGQYIYSRFYWRLRTPYSGYNDYNAVDLARLKKALEDIKSTADAHHARMAVFLIPRYNDFLRFHQAGENRLGPVMVNWGRDEGIPMKDLLPEMDAQSAGDYRSYFLTCDGHWSARGDAVAAEILEPWLGEKPGEKPVGKIDSGK